MKRKVEVEEMLKISMCTMCLIWIECPYCQFPADLRKLIGLFVSLYSLNICEKKGTGERDSKDQVSACTVLYVWCGLNALMSASYWHRETNKAFCVSSLHWLDNMHVLEVKDSRTQEPPIGNVVKSLKTQNTRHSFFNKPKFIEAQLLRIQT